MRLLWLAGIMTIFFLIGELFSYWRNRHVSEQLEQHNKTSMLPRAVLLTAIFALVAGIILSAFFHDWREYRPSVAIVVDQTIKKESIFKNVISDFVDRLPGVPVSLYVLEGKRLERLVPQTIDRLYFKILLDSIQASVSSELNPNKSKNWDLDEAKASSKTDSSTCLGLSLEDIKKSLRKENSWIVVVSDHQVSKIVPHGMSLIVMKGGPPSIDGLIRLLKFNTQAPVEQKSFLVAFLLIIFSFVAWLGFIFWGRLHAPLLFLFFCSSLFGIEPMEANRIFFQAEQGAEVDGESEKRIEYLLSVVSDGRARKRLLYDRALFAYKNKRYEEALRWIDIDPTIQLDKEEEQKIANLQGLCLWRLSEKISVPLAAEEIQLALEQPHYKENTLSTLVWLEQNQLLPFKQWLQEMLSFKPTPDEQMRFLLQEAASNAGQWAVFRDDRYRENVAILEQKIFARTDHFYRNGFKTAQGEAALWYVRSLVWPVFEQKKPIDLLYILSAQFDLQVSQLVKDLLVAFSRRVFSLKERLSFEETWDQIFMLSFKENSEDALELLFSYSQNPSWHRRIVRILETIQPPNTLLAKEIDRGLGDQVEFYDLSLTILLWKLSVAREVQSQVGASVQLFERLYEKMQNFSDPILRSLCLIFAVQPFIEDEFTQSKVFSDEKRQGIYEQLVLQWSKICAQIVERINNPAMFRRQSMKQDVKQALILLRKIYDLFREQKIYEPVIKKEIVTIEEDPVRLFQRMDRADRALRGNYE